MQLLAASLAVLCTAAAFAADGAAQPTTRPSVTPSFEELPAMEIAGIATYDKPDSGAFGKLWEHFQTDVEGQPGIDRKTALYGVATMSPSAKQGFFPYIAGAKVSDATKVPHFLLRLPVPAGTYAVFKLEHGLPDAVAEFAPMFMHIYGEWLPGSDYVSAEPLSVERYSPDGSRVEILIPVKKK